MAVSDYDALFEASGKQHNVDPQLLRAVAAVESGGNPNAVNSKSGASGLMQFMPATAAEYGVQDPLKPEQAIPAAARKMRDLLNQHGDVSKALMGYNAGNPTRWNNPETQAYVGKVASAYQQTKGQAVASNEDDPFAAMVEQAQSKSKGSSAKPSSQQADPADDPFGAIVSHVTKAMGDAKAKQESLTPGYINGLVRSIANGVTFGFADKMDAATDSLVTGKPYSEAISDQRQMGKNFADNSPVSAIAGEVAGGIGGMVAAAPLAAGTRAAALASRFPLAGAVATGAGMGALSGAGNTDGSFGNQMEGAAIGAGAGGLLGGALGVAAPMIGATAGRIANAAYDRFLKAPGDVAGRKLAQAMSRDGISPDMLRNKLAQLGPEASVVDAGGANVRNLAESVASTPGPGSQKAVQFLEGRMEGAGGRINQAVNDATQGKGNYHANIDDLVTQRSQQSTPLYEQALNSGPVNSDRVRQFLDDPVLKQGLKQGLEVQRLESLAANKPFNPHDYAITGFNEAGDPVLGQVPNMRLLDAAKRGLDNILEQYRDTTTGKLVLDQRGRAIDAVRKAYVSELDSVNPAYKEARQAWAGPSQAMDALAKGRAALSNDPEVTAKMVGSMSPSEKEFFLNGVARALKDKVDGTKDGADATRRIFGDKLTRQKIEAAFDSPEAFAKFEDTMARESRFAMTRNEVLKGSQTARRQAGQEDLPVDPNPLMHLMQGRPISAALGVARQGINAMTRQPAAQSEPLGNMLFSPSGSDLLPKITTQAQQLQATQALKNKLLMLGAGTVGSAPQRLRITVTPKD